MSLLFAVSFVRCSIIRCPAYVDLYARSAKPKGTWTVYCVVQRGKKGTFSLRSDKNLSILPMATVRSMRGR